MYSIYQLVGWLQTFDERIDLEQLKSRLDDELFSAELR